MTEEKTMPQCADRRPLLSRVGALVCRLIAHAVLLLCIAVTATGCATWAKHGVVLDSSKIRVVVMPVQSAVRIKHMADIRTVAASDRNVDATNETAQISAEMQEVTRELERCIVTNMNRSYFFEVVPPEQVIPVLAALGIGPDRTPLTVAQATAIGQQLNARTILSTRLSGYGKIKRKWLFFLIGSGVVEGTVQGVVVAAAVSNPWVGVGVAAEEILQESLTWGGGAYLFNRIFTPVILEAELVSTSDGEVIWSDTSFVRINRKALKQLPDSERKKKEVRLKLTAEAAVQELVTDLNKTAFRNVKLER